MRALEHVTWVKGRPGIGDLGWGLTQACSHLGTLGSGTVVPQEEVTTHSSESETQVVIIPGVC